jgi:hypothetical protein
MRCSSLCHPLFQGLVRQPQPVGHVMPATMRHLEGGRDLGQKFAGIDEKPLGVGTRRRLLYGQPKHGVMQRQKVEQAVSFGKRRSPQLKRSNELGFRHLVEVRCKCAPIVSLESRVIRRCGTHFSYRQTDQVGPPSSR